MVYCIQFDTHTSNRSNRGKDTHMLSDRSLNRIQVAARVSLITGAIALVLSLLQMVTEYFPVPDTLSGSILIGSTAVFLFGFLTIILGRYPQTTTRAV